MIEQQLQSRSQKIKCGNCSKIMEKLTLYGCCYMLVCQQCFDRLHYLNCNYIISKTQEILNIQILSQQNKTAKKIECQCCQLKQASQHCKNCKKNFCEQCCSKIHSKAKYLLHQKSKLKKLDQMYDKLKIETKNGKLSLCLIHQKPRNIIIDELIVCKDCQTSTQLAQNKNNVVPQPIQSVQKVSLQITIQKFRNLVYKSKQKESSQLQYISTMQAKMKQQYEKICITLQQRYQANQNIIQESKKNIQKEISQNLSLLTRRLTQIESINTILKNPEFSQNNSSILKTRVNYLKEMIMKTQKSITEYAFYNLQIKYSQFQESLQQLLKNFMINKSKTNNNGSFLNQKMQNSTNMRVSQNCSSMKVSRQSSRLSTNRLNSATGKSVSKLKKTQQKEKQTTGTKSIFSCNFNQKQKNQMCQSYKVNLNKQYQKQSNSNKSLIKQKQHKDKGNKQNNFAEQINQIQKTQHQQLNLDLNRLNNKNNSFKLSQDIKLQFHNNVFQNSKEKQMSSKKKQCPRSNKFLQSSSENQNKSSSVSKKKNPKDTKKMYTPSVTKLSIKKQLFQDKSKLNILKSKSSRDSNSTNRRNENKSQKNEKQTKNIVTQTLGNNITDFQDMNKEIDEKLKIKMDHSVFQSKQKQKTNKKNNLIIQAPMTRSINIQYKQKQKQSYYYIQQDQIKKNQKEKNIQCQSMKQNCYLSKDLLKQNKNKNNSFVQKPKKKSDLLDMRDMMRKPNLIGRQNLADKNIKTKI